MKKLFNFRLLVLIGVLIMSINTGWGQTFSTAQQPNVQIQSQPIMNGGAYTGTVYEPFSGTTPSEQSYSPAKVPGGPRRVGENGGEDFSGFDVMGDTKPSEESPIGEPWVMLFFALAFAGVIAIRHYKRNINSTSMNNSTNKFFATLALLITFGVGQMWGWNDVYLIGDMYSNWSSGRTDHRIGTGGSGSMQCYFAENNYFAFYITGYNEKAGPGSNGDTKTTDGNKTRFYIWDQGENSNAAQYTGNSGIVEVHYDQVTDNHDGDPDVWLTRPTVYLYNSWGNGSWTWKSTTDEGNGYYYVDATYGANGVNWGTNGTSAWQAGGKDAYITCTPSPSTIGAGHPCRYRLNTSATNSGADQLSLSITALWTVNFNLQGHGSSIDSQEKLHGETAEEPSDPSQTGYIFGGWYTTPACTGEAYDFSTPLSDDLELYAKWTAIEYTLTFNKNGEAWSDAAGATTKTRKIVFDQAYSSSYASQGAIPSMATKNAYYFKGWYTATSDGTKIINADGTFVTSVDGYTDEDGKWIHDGDLTLYAQYGVPVMSISFSPDSVMPLDSVTVTVNFDNNPEGSYTLCYKLTTTTDPVKVMNPQPEWKKDGFSAKFEAPSDPSNYTVQVRLFSGENNCGSDAGYVAIYNSTAKKFTVEAANAITVKYMCGSSELRRSTTVYATFIASAATVTAPDIEGMTFSRWTTGSNVYLSAGSSATNKTVSVHASAAGTLTAEYSQGPLFFKNTKNWDKVYVYFYNARRWYRSPGSNESEGTGSNGSQFISGPHRMTLMPNTDEVYYYAGEFPGSTAAVAFSQDSMPNYDYFSKSKDDPCEVVYAESLNSSKPMIVPIGSGATWNYNTAKYYAHDKAPVLMDWGYNLRGAFNSWSATKQKFKSEKLGDLSFRTTVYIDAATTQEWKLYQGNTGWGKTGGPTLTKTNPESATLDNYNADGYNLQIQSNTPGEYIFTLNYGTSSASGTYDGAASSTGIVNQMKMKVTFPIVEGDYRLVYTGGTRPHPSDIITKRKNGLDTVSMFVAKDHAADLKFQICSSTTDASVSWGSATAFTSLTKMKFAEGKAFTNDTITKYGAGVYNFIIQQSSDSTKAEIIKVEKYTGRFYVRTNCVNDDKWNYKDSKDAHAMTYSEFSTTLTSPDKPFSHYYVKDLHGKGGSTVNIKFTVANDFSEAITDTVVNGESSSSDPYYDTYGSEHLNRTANVRFTYDMASNKIWRAYTEGPENDNYMVLKSNGSSVATSIDGSGNLESPSGAIKFSDMGNWVYKMEAYSLVNTYVKLTAEMHNSAGTAKTQYLKGNSGDGYSKETGVLLIGGTGSAQHMSITYDFKTDRMITAWLPSDAPVDGAVTIDADVMLIRDGQNAGQSIRFADTSGDTLKIVKTVYGVMQFDSSYVNDVSRSRYSRSLYWISFPFDVKLSDVFGFGTFNKHWAIEYYDGKGRAKGGYWIDSDPNWKFVTSAARDTFVLKANEGYVLALALGQMAGGSTVWTNVNRVYLYFPSAKQIGTITNVPSKSIPIDTVGYQCTINRGTATGDRRIKDSHWHCIGVPSFAGAAHTSGTAAPTSEAWTANLPYIYDWNSTSNTLSVNTTGNFSFDAMKSYLVQFKDVSLSWSNVSNQPEGIVERHKIEGREASYYEWNLNLLNGEEQVDHTYIRMSNDENATEEFDFGNDLSKEMNEGANIYTLIGYEQVAGNVIPLDMNTTKVVPVGVQIAESGVYTFAMPEGTHNVGAVLLDNVTGTRTNLALLDYTVELTEGTYENRFYLEISPIAEVPTGIGETDADVSSVRKVVVDGTLYIVKDGQVYDARGCRLE